MARKQVLVDLDNIIAKKDETLIPEHIKKDVPAYHIDNNTFNEEKTKTYEEMTDDELDRQYEELKRQREERRKRRKENDFEM